MSECSARVRSRGCAILKHDVVPCHALPTTLTTTPTPTHNKFKSLREDGDDDDNDKEPETDAEHDEQHRVDNIAAADALDTKTLTQKITMPRIKRTSQAERYKIATLPKERYMT